MGSKQNVGQDKPSAHGHYHSPPTAVLNSQLLPGGQFQCPQEWQPTGSDCTDHAYVEEVNRFLDKTKILTKYAPKEQSEISFSLSDSDDLSDISLTSTDVSENDRKIDALKERLQFIEAKIEKRKQASANTEQKLVNIEDNRKNPKTSRSLLDHKS